MNIHAPALSPLAELAANVARPFGEARAMPKSVYTSEEFLAAELRHVFAKEWYCVGRASALAKPGDYVTFELAGQPLMVMRGRDGNLSALSNVCLHRMSTLLEGRGNRASITCPYHGWTYNIDGSLRAAPKCEEVLNFRREEVHLAGIGLEVIGGFVFVNLEIFVASHAEEVVLQNLHAREQRS